jgi:hypothetical protein
MAREGQHTGTPVSWGHTYVHILPEKWQSSLSKQFKVCKDPKKHERKRKTNNIASIATNHGQLAVPMAPILQKEPGFQWRVISSLVHVVIDIRILPMEYKPLATTLNSISSSTSAINLSIPRLCARTSRKSLMTWLTRSDVFVSA